MTRADGCVKIIIRRLKMNYKLSDKKYTAKAENGRIVTGTVIWQETFGATPRRIYVTKSATSVK